MTREEAKAVLPVMQAYTEGRQIQVKVDGHWKDVTEPAFNPCYTYRVKPANEWFQNLANQYHWYIAKDSSGSVYAYKNKPALDPDYDYWSNERGDYFCLSKDMFPNRPEFEGDWDKVLIEPEYII